MPLPDAQYVTEEELQYIKARLNKTAAADKQAPSTSTLASGSGSLPLKPSYSQSPNKMPPRVPASRAPSRQTSLGSQQVSSGGPSKPSAAAAAAVGQGQAGAIAMRQSQPPTLQHQGSSQRQASQLQRHTSLPAPSPAGGPSSGVRGSGGALAGATRGPGGRRVQFSGMSSAASSASIGASSSSLHAKPGIPRASPSKAAGQADPKAWQGPKPIAMPPRLPAR